MMSETYEPETSSTVTTFVRGTYDPPVCQWCGTGMYHVGVCPRVKAIEYNQYGQVTRVEFHKPGARAEVADDE